MQLNEKAVFLPSLTSKVKKSVTVQHIFSLTHWWSKVRMFLWSKYILLCQTEFFFFPFSKAKLIKILLAHSLVLFTSSSLVLTVIKRKHEKYWTKWQENGLSMSSFRVWIRSDNISQSCVAIRFTDMTQWWKNLQSNTELSRKSPWELYKSFVKSSVILNLKE